MKDNNKIIKSRKMNYLMIKSNQMHKKRAKMKMFYLKTLLIKKKIKLLKKRSSMMKTLKIQEKYFLPKKIYLMINQLIIKNYNLTMNEILLKKIIFSLSRKII